MSVRRVSFTEYALGNLSQFFRRTRRVTAALGPRGPRAARALRGRTGELRPAGANGEHPTAPAHVGDRPRLSTPTPLPSRFSPLAALRFFIYVIDSDGSRRPTNSEGHGNRMVPCVCALYFSFSTSRRVKIADALSYHEPASENRRCSIVNLVSRSHRDHSRSLEIPHSRSRTGKSRSYVAQR